MIALAGDDHGCQSSTLPHQSEQVFAAAMIPVVNPADVQEYLDFGILGFALSRYSGLLGRLQGDLRDGRERRLGMGRSGAHQDRACRPISSCRRAGSASATPIRRSTRNGACTGRRWRRCRPSSAPTASTSMVIDPPRARIGIMTTGKAYLDIAPGARGSRPRRTKRCGARHPPLQGRHDLAARAGRRAALRRRACRKSSSSRRSAPTSRTSSSACSTTCRPTGARW